MSTTTGQPITLFTLPALPAPTAPGDGGDISPLHDINGGPDRLVIILTTSADVTLTDVRAYLFEDGAWDTLAVAGASDLMFTSLALSTARGTRFQIQDPGRATRFALSATLGGAANITATCSRGSRV